MKKITASILAVVFGLLVSSLVFGAGFYPQQPPSAGYPPSPTFTHWGTTSGTATDNIVSDKGFFTSILRRGGFNVLTSNDNAYTRQDRILGGQSFTDNIYAHTLFVGGTGPHRIGPQNYESSNDSFVNITGTFGNTDFSGPGDNRALGITTRIYTDNVGGGRSSEGMNVRPSFVLPPTGQIATLEGIHIDFMGWANWQAGGCSGSDNCLFIPTAATVGGVFGLRILGVQIPPGVQTVAAIMIDAGWRGSSDATNVYNILSAGATSRNRINGYLEVYGATRHTIGNGSSPEGNIGLIIDPTSDNTGGAGVQNFSALVRIGHHSGSTNPAPNHDSFGLLVAPRYVKAASGNHGQVVGAEFRPPVDIGGTAGISYTSTVKITSAPTGGAVNNYALWVGGKVRWDDGIAIGSTDNVTLGKTGGSGPTNVAQAKWLRVIEGGTDYFIPVWQ